MLTSTNRDNLWLFPNEVCAMWGFAKRTVEYAIWKDHIKSRQSVVGRQWMVEYNSCVANWGLPKRNELLEEIQYDVNY